MVKSVKKIKDMYPVLTGALEVLDGIDLSGFF